MKSFREHVTEEAGSGSSLPLLPYEKNPKIGWWRDGDHLNMYHGTHQSRLEGIARSGIHAPKEGPTAGWVSMTHDPHTAHGYAAMSGESAFRAAGAKAVTVPHDERVVLHARIPREWAEKNMNHHLRGNIDGYSQRMTDRSTYDAHVQSGRQDHEHYQGTELRFKDSVPREFIVGYSRRYQK